MSQNPYEDEKNIDTVLGDDIKFKGTLTFKKSLKIKGKFDGQIEDAGVLIVGANAIVNADIKADDVIIQGSVKGNIIAKKSLELKRHSHLTGDIKTPDLNINSGALFNGKCVMESL